MKVPSPGEEMESISLILLSLFSSGVLSELLEQKTKGRSKSLVAQGGKHQQLVALWGHFPQSYFKSLLQAIPLNHSEEVPTLLPTVWRNRNVEGGVGGRGK